MAESQNIEYKEPWWSISCKERYDTYFRYMNEDALKGYDLRCRYLYKIYQVGVSPMYTKDERKSVVDSLFLFLKNRMKDLVKIYICIGNPILMSGNISDMFWEKKILKH